jgi:hypothetical protein
MCLRMEIKLCRAIRAQHGIAADRFARDRSVFEGISRRARGS